MREFDRLDDSIVSNLSKLDVDNVFLYVGDAVRWDLLPDLLSNRGFCIKGISSSIHTPTSFASLITGRYLPQHQVRDFGQTVSPDFPNLLKIPSMNTAFANTINSEHFNSNPHNDPEHEGLIMNVLDADGSRPEELESIEPPFLFIERGPGGHAPYGNFTGNAWEYFRNKGNAPIHQYKQDYIEKVMSDVSWFWNQVSVLRDRGVLDDTLVIYTSDHGELLGEVGMLGHNAPIHQKLVTIPAVLIHNKINPLTIREEIIRHVDFLPTLASLLGVDGHSFFDGPGVDLTSRSPASTGASYYTVTRSLPTVPGSLSFKYSSLWDATGGYVFPECSRFTRIAAYLNQSLRGPSRSFLLNNALSNFPQYLRGAHVQGCPGFSMEKADSMLSAVGTSEPNPVQSNHDDVNEEQLKQLGYLR